MTYREYDVSGKTNWHPYDVVGISHYLETIDELAESLFAVPEEEEFFNAELVPEPDNPHSPNGEAISVRWENHVIGYLASEDAAKLQQLRRITASGYTPVCSGRLWYRLDSEGDADYYVRVSIREPEQLCPLNNPPETGWALLPRGKTTQVTKEADHLDVLLDYVPPSGTGTLLATLHIVVAGTRTKYESIEVRLDGQRIGELSKAMSARFVDVVRHYEDQGLITAAWATIKGSAIAAEVTLQAVRSNEISDADLTPTIAPLLPLVAYQENPRAYQVPPAYGTGNRLTPPPLSPQMQPPSRQPHPAAVPAPPPYAPPPAPGTSVPPAALVLGGALPTPNQVVPTSGMPPAGAPGYRPYKAPEPSKVVTVFLWGGFAFGCLAGVAALGALSSSVRDAVSVAMFALMHLVGCGWLLHCRAEDKKQREQWRSEQAENARRLAILDGTEPLITAALQPVPPPKPKARRWKTLCSVLAIFLVIGVLTAPDDVGNTTDDSGYSTTE